MSSNRRFATVEGHPAVYDDEEAWVLFHAEIGWVGVNLAWAMQRARPLSEAEFRQSFPDLPSAPEFPETPEQRERLLGQFSGHNRELIEDIMADHPGLTAAHCIDMLRAFGGL